MMNFAFEICDSTYRFLNSCKVRLADIKFFVANSRKLSKRTSGRGGVTLGREAAATRMEGTQEGALVSIPTEK